MSELRAKLTATKDHNTNLRKHIDGVETSRRQLENQVLEVKEERDNA